MATTKYLKTGGATGITEGTTIDTSAGAGDSGKIPSLDSSGKLDSTFMPTGFGSDTLSLTAGEALSAGDLIYINGSGQMLKADADSASKAAVGFVLSSVSNGATGTAYLGGGLITGLTSLTSGAAYFLSQTAGGITTTAPSGTNVIVQSVGYAASATVLVFLPQQPVLLI